MLRPARKLSISLPEELVDAVRRSVRSGRYTSFSEVVRDALRVWQVDEPLTEEVAGLTPARLLDIELLGMVRGFRKLAIRGTVRQRRVMVAARFRPPLPLGLTPEAGRFALGSKLEMDWGRQVEVVDFDTLDDLDGWTVVYDADLPAARDTDSSSTS